MGKRMDEAAAESSLAGDGRRFSAVTIAQYDRLAHAFWKLVLYIAKRLAGGQLSSTDREIPFGPYLSMAAATLVLSWRWLWPNYAKDYFENLHVLFWFLLEQLIASRGT